MNRYLVKWTRRNEFNLPSPSYNTLPPPVSPSLSPSLVSCQSNQPPHLSLSLCLSLSSTTSPNKKHILSFHYFNPRSAPFSKVNMEKEVGGGRGGGMQTTRTRRAEIDTRRPFRSVKEAVALFGEKVLAGELYASQLKQMQNEANRNGHNPALSRIGTVTAELEDTKQSLQKAREESELMENCLSSLKQELDLTKRELQQLKEREYEKHFIETEIEDVRTFDEDSTKFETKPQASSEEDESFEFQKKRYVTFANPPSLAKVMIAPGGVEETLERHPSLKKKKKPLIPLISGIFSKKKGSSPVAYA